MEPIFEEIASREYRIKGRNEKVVVSLGKPQKISQASDYYCPYKISISSQETVKKIFGVDGFQAIYLTFRIIDSELQNIVKNKSIELDWDGGPFGKLSFPE